VLSVWQCAAAHPNFGPAQCTPHIATALSARRTGPVRSARRRHVHGHVSLMSMHYRFPIRPRAPAPTHTLPPPARSPLHSPSCVRLSPAHVYAFACASSRSRPRPSCVSPRPRVWTVAAVSRVRSCRATNDRLCCVRLSFRERVCMSSVTSLAPRADRVPSRCACGCCVLGCNVFCGLASLFCHVEPMARCQRTTRLASHAEFSPRVIESTRWDASGFGRARVSRSGGRAHLL
jgi:hypothetical protein